MTKHLENDEMKNYEMIQVFFDVDVMDAAVSSPVIRPGVFLLWREQKDFRFSSAFIPVLFDIAEA